MVFSELENKNMYSAWTCKIDNCTVSKSTSLKLKSYGVRTIIIDPSEEPDYVEMSHASYYTITFTHTFKHDNDKVYFAFCKPYSYMRLRNMYTIFEKDIGNRYAAGGRISIPNDNSVIIEGKDLFYKREQLATSLGGLPVEILTIAANSNMVDAGKIS